MSHLVEIQIELRDLDAISAACRELKKTLVRAPVGKKVRARTWAGALVDCDAYIRLDGPYDLLLTREPNGTYKPQADLWGGHVENELGKGCKRLVQFYGVCKAELAARKLGHTVQRQTLKNGSINLTITGRTL